MKSADDNTKNEAYVIIQDRSSCHFLTLLNLFMGVTTCNILTVRQRVLGTLRLHYQL
jgi:hypothetical protein